MDRQGLEIARLEAIWRQGDEIMLRVRWYMIPEETHVGRQVLGCVHGGMVFATTHNHPHPFAQSHHARRELFLTTLTDIIPAESLLRPVIVVRSMAQLEATQGNDVFVCEYLYDTEWQVWF